MLLSRRSTDKVLLLLVVQSSIIRTVLVRLRPAEKPLIFFMHTDVIPYHPRAGTAHLIKNTLKVVRDSVEIALHSLHVHATSESGLSRHISEIHYILSSPWIVSQAKTVTRTFSKPTIVTKKAVMEIVAAERVKDEPADSPRIETIEEKIFDIRLNEYSIAHWEGRMADKVDVSFAASVAGTGMIERFREACAHAGGPKAVHFHSSLLLQHIGIQLALPDEGDYMLIHVHGELTDIVIVEHRMCVFFGSFPQGINTVIRSVARATDTSPAIADSLLTLHTDKHSSQHKNAEEAIANTAADWTNELEKLFTRAAYGKTLPSVVIVTARSHEDFFSQIFHQSHTGSRLRAFSAEEIAPLVAYDPLVENQRLIGLFAIALNSLERAEPS